MNNVSKTIGWADYTWNPVTGCRRGCDYCYARRIHNRFHPEKPFDTVEFHRDRLAEPKKLKRPSTIFVGSMSDCEYWEPELWYEIMCVITAVDRHTFMFLSKCVHSYDFVGQWPENCMQGLTMERVTTIEDVDTVHRLAKLPRPFLSLEPLRAKVSSTIPIIINPVIVGSMTGPGATKATGFDVGTVKIHTSPSQIYWKNSIPKAWR